MSSKKIRENFLKFFAERGHKIVPSSPLVPDDPSVLLTTAGMQQFKRYYTGELDALRDFGSRRTASVQKCFRTSDIDEVGDETHLTFFEMLGNFSFGPVGSDDPADRGTGGYLKRSSICWAYEFLTDVLKIAPERITVSVFKGEEEIPFDEKSYKIWREEIGVSESRIFLGGRADNFWGPTGDEGPCGPTTEIYVDGVEIWNIVFNEYYKERGDGLKKAENPGVDTGMGVERLAAVLQEVGGVFETDLLRSLVLKIAEPAPGLEKRFLRILADHLRASAFLIAGGVRPANKEAGYILRRLLRRILAYKIKHGIGDGIFSEAAKIVGDEFGGIYPEVGETGLIIEVLEEEKRKFEKAVGEGLKKIGDFNLKGVELTGRLAFDLYQTDGLPLEISREFFQKKASDLEEAFKREFAEHQEVSRAGAEKKFGGHGLALDTGELKARDEAERGKVIRLHTATHLLHQALRDVLGPEVRQMGSDITAERTRFDFSWPRKLTPEEIKKAEGIVNEKIEANLPVSFTEMSKEEAAETGALHFFKEKYPERVKVYSVGDYSREFCNGPHVPKTGEIGVFKIIKEEAVSAGVRRIRATVL